MAPSHNRQQSHETEPDNNPVALVTGASRGIGRSIALMLARFQFRVVLTGRTAANLEETASLILQRTEDPGAEPVVIPEDLADPAAPRRLVGEIQRTIGRMDVLVNNAGAVVAGPLESYTIEQWDTIMALNARAPFFLMKESLPLLRAARRGCIVNIGSVVSRAGYAGQALYTASKHALLGMTKATARELAPHGIRVHAVLPGGVNTDMVRDVRPDIDTSELISPEEVAEAVGLLIAMEGNAVIDELMIRRASKTPWSM